MQQAGLGLMIGGMVETRLAMGFAAHMAAGLNSFRLDSTKTHAPFCNRLSTEAENFLDPKFFLNSHLIVDEWKVGC